MNGGTLLGRQSCNRARELSPLILNVIFCSNILRNLATIQADVASHAEAMLHGRLSKSHQETISSEQKRYLLHKAKSQKHFNLAGHQEKEVPDAPDLEVPPGDSPGPEAGGLDEHSLVAKEDRRTLWDAIRKIQFNVFR